MQKDGRMGVYSVEAGRKDEYIQKFGDWMDKYPWQKFLTLTFAYHNVSVKRAGQLFEQFVKTLGEDVYYVVVFEHFYLANTVHIHALVFGVTKDIVWSHGIVKAYDYDVTKGAKFYIAKHLKSGKADSDYRLPPCKAERKPCMSQKRLTPLKAIRNKCLLDCSCGQRSEVRDCVIPECFLYPYRLGKNPHRKGIGGRRKSVQSGTTS